MLSAFQTNAFQNNAYQLEVGFVPPVVKPVGGFPRTVIVHNAHDPIRPLHSNDQDDVLQELKKAPKKTKAKINEVLDYTDTDVLALQNAQALEAVRLQGLEALRLERMIREEEEIIALLYCIPVIV